MIPVFQALSVIFFLSFVVQILYYYGIMQWIIIKTGWLLQVSMDTTVCESLNASATVFLSLVRIYRLYQELILTMIYARKSVKMEYR